MCLRHARFEIDGNTPSPAKSLPGVGKVIIISGPIARARCMTANTVKILYLENHAVFAAQVTRQFLSEHTVTIVASLAAGRNALASENYDLILSDYDLVDGKGEEFVRECRRTYPQLPVIAASAHDVGNEALVRAGVAAVCGNIELVRNIES